MTMKKLLALLLVLVMVVALVACGGNGNETEAPTNNSQPASDATENNDNTDNSDTPVGTDLKVAVFYYTYSDTYISSVRTALDAQLDALGVTYQDFDSNGNQTTQNEAIQTAIADGYNLLIVNMVTSGSSDTAKGIMELAGDVPVIFFNRAVDEDGVEASASVLNAYENIAFVGTDAPEAGHLQGKMIGEYVLEHYDELDLNGDGKVVVQVDSYTVDFDAANENTDAYYQMAGVTRLSAELSSGGKTYIFLLEDPEGFETQTGALQYLDGTVPDDPETTDADWREMVYRWTDCPVLTGLDLGGYEGLTLMDDVTGTNQSVLAHLYVGRRGVWDEKQVPTYEGCAELWDTLTAGAVSTAAE